jgi:hypothetical protein
LAWAAAGAPRSAATSRARLCADRVAVYDTPGGFVIAHLYRPQRLRVLGTAHRRRWSLVRFDSGPRGWILTRRICD